MEHGSSVRWWWAAYLLWAAASIHVALCVDRSVPEPYMVSPHLFNLFNL
jgi:hypothetical protein